MDQPPPQPGEPSIANENGDTIMAKHGKKKRTVVIRGAEFEGRDAKTATEQAFADRFARIQRDRKREAVEAREAMA